jgi:hypothetical protein
VAIEADPLRTDHASGGLAGAAPAGLPATLVWLAVQRIELKARVRLSSGVIPGPDHANIEFWQVNQRVADRHDSQQRSGPGRWAARR